MHGKGVSLGSDELILRVSRAMDIRSPCMLVLDDEHYIDRNKQKPLLTQW